MVQVQVSTSDFMYRSSVNCYQNKFNVGQCFLLVSWMVISSEILLITITFPVFTAESSQEKVPRKIKITSLLKVVVMVLFDYDSVIS